MMRSASFALAWAASALLAAAPLHAAPTAGAQRDPELKAVVGKAIQQAECFSDHYDSAVWYKMMEPKLRKRIKDRDERMELLKLVFCEAHRKGEVRLPPGLVMAVMQVESGFNRWAVSTAGAVGLMQVMPFWPEQLGMKRYELSRMSPNIQMGCAILRHYLKRENYNVARALQRYNGSLGRREYSDMIISSWSRWNGADDLGLAKNAQPLRPKTY